jgi:uncharacterized tellurite resistance protein B-like protein
MSRLNPGKTHGKEEPVDEREFLPFLHQIVTQFEIPVAGELKRLTDAFPDLSSEGIADHLNYAPLDRGFTATMQGIWQKIRKDSPFLVNGGLAPILVEFLFRVILQIDLLAETFRPSTASYPREELILNVLFNEVLLQQNPTDARHELREIVKFTTEFGKERIGKEVLLDFRAKYGWKTLRHSGKSFLDSPLYGSAIFLHLRQTGLLAKFLFNDGRLSGGELSDLHQFQQSLLKKVLAALISMAHADGRISPEEKEFIRGFCEQFGLDVPTLEFYEFDPEMVTQLSRAFPSPEQKAFFLACLRDVMESDAHIDEAENTFLDMLAQNE